MKMYAALTFDDGYLSHLDVAYFLYKLGIRATFFIITCLKNFEGKPLLTINPRYIQLINDMGHEIGSHSCTHARLDKLQANEIERELIESKRYLENLLGRKVKGFAYPSGFYNKDVVLMVARYYDYARLAGKRFEARTWNAVKRIPYMIEGIGAKELVKLPVKYVLYKNIHPVIVFHDDPIKLVNLVVKTLRSIGAEFVTLSELVRVMFYE